MKRKILQFIPIVLIALTSFYIGHALSSTPNTTIYAGSGIQSDNYIIWNNAGMYQAKDDTGNPAALISTDIGVLTNAAIAACPTVLNQQSGRTVPICKIMYRSNPSYNGTTAISLYDDWFVSLVGEVPCSLSMANPATIYASVIDIESSTGVVQLSHGGSAGDGGGSISIENLCFRTKTSITAPLNGASRKFVLQMGNQNNVNYARLILSHVGCKDDSGTNGCFALWSQGADDLTETNDIFASCTGSESCVYINAFDYIGLGVIETSITAVSNPTAFSYAFYGIGQGTFKLDALTFAGIFNGILRIDAGIGGCSVGCAAQIGEITFSPFSVLTAFPGPSTGYRVLLSAPTFITKYILSGGIYPDDMFNYSTATPAIINAFRIESSSLARNFHLLPFPFGTYVSAGTFLPPSNRAIGSYYDGAANPTCGTTYTVLGLPLYSFSLTGGTGVSITIKDVRGFTLINAAATVTNQYLNGGDTVSLTCSAPPTASVWQEAIV